MSIIMCSSVSNEKPHVYRLKFEDRCKNVKRVTCIESYNYDVEYIGMDDKVYSISGEIELISVDPKNFNRSYLLMDNSHDFELRRVFFDKICSIKPSRVNDAYYISVMHGFEGTLSDWLDCMRGPRGYSAYEIALQQGFMGTEKEWIKSLSPRITPEDMEIIVDKVLERLKSDV